MESTDFTSREDKVIWVLVFFLLNGLGAILFWINFKNREEIISQIEIETYHELQDEFKKIDIEVYEELKQKKPDFVSQIESALSLPVYRRESLEKRYWKKDISKLKRIYNNGPQYISSDAFGVLLAVLEMEINPNK